MIQALLWDMDGVFVDTEEIHFESWKWLVEHVGASPLTLEEYIPCVGHSGIENIAYLAKLKNLPGDLEALRILRREKFEEFRERGIPVITENVKLIKEWVREFPDLRQIVVSSASRTDIEKNIEVAGLQNIFEKKISYEDKPNMARKPSPEIYLCALEETKLRADQCIAFEDTKSGVAAAYNAGLIVVALPNRLTMQHDFSLAKLVIQPSLEKDAKEIMNSLDS